MADEREHKLPMTGEELEKLLEKASNSLEATYDPDTKILKIFGGGTK